MQYAALRLDDVPALETDAVAQVLVRRRDRMHAVARRVCRDADDADDAVQDACVAALRARSGFEARSQASTWVHRIVVNAALMRLRTRRRRAEEPLEVLLEHDPETEPSAEVRAGSGELRALVRNCIDGLPEPHRTVLVLRDLEEHDTAETAARLGVTVNAVKIRLHRARHALRSRLVGARLEEALA
jgi:RNA polymerase sigma-70 factor (ECF subfamily)